MVTKIGRYQVLEKLSENSKFLVKDSEGNRKILKKYELDLAKVLKENKVKVLMSLHHVNLLPPSDIFKRKNYQYVVYDYSCDNNLQEYIEKKGQLTEKEILTISKQIIYRTIHTCST